MAALVATSRIPSLDSALGIKDLQKSRDAYNELLNYTEQPPISGEHIRELAALFVRHNAHRLLPRGRWTTVKDIGAVDLSIVHGHIFVLTKDGFIAYEYQEGPQPDLSSVEKEFLADFIDYLVINSLTNLVSLQILADGVNQTMWELILDKGTVMLDVAVVRGCSPTRITGWRFEAWAGQPRVCQTNETHAEMTSGNHKVFDAGKPQPKLSDIDDLKKALVDVGVL